MTASTEVRRFERGRIELPSIAGGTVARFELRQVGKWSTDLKPIVKTEWCEPPRLQYGISGK